MTIVGDGDRAHLLRDVLQAGRSGPCRLGLRRSPQAVLDDLRPILGAERLGRQRRIERRLDGLSARIGARHHLPGPARSSSWVKAARGATRTKPQRPRGRREAMSWATFPPIEWPTRM